MAHEDVTSHVETKQSTTKKEQTDTSKRENVKSEKKEHESLYTIEELSANAKQLFGVRTECVVAALKAVGIKECTVFKAKEIISKFMKKEVK